MASRHAENQKISLLAAGIASSMVAAVRAGHGHMYDRDLKPCDFDEWVQRLFDKALAQHGTEAFKRPL